MIVSKRSITHTCSCCYCIKCCRLRIVRNSLRFVRYTPASLEFCNNAYASCNLSILLIPNSEIKVSSFVLLSTSCSWSLVLSAQNEVLGPRAGKRRICLVLTTSFLEAIAPTCFCWTRVWIKMVLWNCLILYNWEKYIIVE